VVRIVADEEAHLSLTTVARRCRVPERTLREWCRSGRILAEHDGYNRHWRIPSSSMPSVLEERSRYIKDLLARLAEDEEENG
jgi:predicted site-specific integrase-resolvase